MRDGQGGSSDGWLSRPQRVTVSTAISSGIQRLERLMVFAPQCLPPKSAAPACGAWVGGSGRSGALAACGAGPTRNHCQEPAMGVSSRSGPSQVRTLAEGIRATRSVNPSIAAWRCRARPRCAPAVEPVRQ